MTNVDSEVKRLLADRPVFVTGAAGFVGSHLTERLVNYGARVHVFVRATSSASNHNLARVYDCITMHRGDLTDRQAVMVALRRLKEDGEQPVVFHLGGQAHVGESWERPYETVGTNITGTLNLLQSIVDLELDCHRIDVAGSSEEYGDTLFKHDDLNFLDETSPLSPTSVYGTSKVGEDFLARNFHRAYDLPCVVTRMFNNYGPRQSPRFITGTIITQALCRDEIYLGYVDSKRDFCYVADGVMGHIHVALFGTPGEVYVYGYGHNVSIQKWYDSIIQVGRKLHLWNEKTLFANTSGRSRLGRSEVEELRVDYSKLHGLTGWKPECQWPKGIAETIRWYADNRERWEGRVDWR